MLRINESIVKIIKIESNGIFWRTPFWKETKERKKLSSSSNENKGVIEISGEFNCSCRRNGIGVQV